MKEHWVTYVFKQFERIYGFSNWKEVSYGTSSAAKLVIKRSNTCFFEGNSPIPDNFVTQEWSEMEIPFLFDEIQCYPIIEEKSTQVVVNMDVIAPSFYFLSGWQEYYSPHRDKMGRFPYDASIQKKLKIVDIPVVNYYFDILKTAIEKAFKTKLTVDLWGEKESGVFLSHDIDKINSGWLEGSFGELKQGKLISALQVASKRGIGKDVWFNFEEICHLERKYNATSTFFFLTEEGKHKGVINADYNIKNDKVRQEINRLKDQGWNIGIHGSYGTSFEEGKLTEEQKKISKPTYANRFHFLSWEQRLTPTILEKSNIKVDCTLGFAEHYGYRNGICHPFNLYDLKQDKMLEILEYPLHVMDTTFEQEKYLDSGSSEVPSVFRRLHAEAKKFNGFTSVLWHNNFLSPYKYSGWREVYEEILEHAEEEAALFIEPNFAIPL